VLASVNTFNNILVPVQLSDDELLQGIDACLLPFKMAIYLKWEFPEAHLNIGRI
jgi:hypothetical protein